MLLVGLFVGLGFIGLCVSSGLFFSRPDRHHGRNVSWVLDLDGFAVQD